MGAVPLVAAGLAGILQRREHGAECGQVRVELLRGHIGVERVDPDVVGELALELGRRAREHQAARRLGAPRQLAEQARLADPGLTLDGEAGRRPGPEGFERGVELVEL